MRICICDGYLDQGKDNNWQAALKAFQEGEEENLPEIEQTLTEC